MVLSCHNPTNVSLKVVDIEGKGNGVITEIEFKKDELLCEYAGELLSYSEGIKREKEYPADFGCFIYYFKYKGKRFW